ncbi:MAG: TrmH family RNA methyltransferase [Patescibacteria group bacterium]
MKTCVLILENLRSVENTASIFRTAEGLGVVKIICVGTTPTPLDRFGRKRADFAKVSLGAENIDWEYMKTQDLGFMIQDLREQGFQILSLEQSSKSKNLKEFKSKKKFVLIVGNEVEGVSSEALEASEAILEIPMRGNKESLNVSVAAGIALFVLI